MHAREFGRRLAIVPHVWRDIPRYARRHLLYSSRTRRDPAWLDAPQLVRLSSAAGGMSLEVTPRDEIGRFLYLYGVWDLAGTRLVRSFLQPGMTVLDVGANVGYYSLVASLRVGDTGLVHSFEPHDEIRSRLARNVARNDLRNVVVRPEAVTSSSGEVRFYRTVEAENQGISSTIEGPTPEGRQRDERHVIVPAISLDDVADGLPGRVDLLKIDVEGAEQAAFQGGERLLSAVDAPLVLFEAYELDPPAVLLERYGFTIRRLTYHWRRGLRLASAREHPFQGEPNYIAYKKYHEAVIASLL